MASTSRRANAWCASSSGDCVASVTDSMCRLSEAQSTKPYSRASTNCASASVIWCLSGSTVRTRARDLVSPSAKRSSSSFACLPCWARSGRRGRVRRNGDDMGRLLRYGRRPHDRPEEGAMIRTASEVGAALSADRRRPERRRGKVRLAFERTSGGPAGRCALRRGRIVHHECGIKHTAAAEQGAERFVRRMNEIHVARGGVRECQLIHVREPLVELLRAVVHAVLEGEDSRDLILQRRERLRDLADLLRTRVRLVPEHHDVTDSGGGQRCRHGPRRGSRAAGKGGEADEAGDQGCAHGLEWRWADPGYLTTPWAAWAECPAMSRRRVRLRLHDERPTSTDAAA